jgi:hypothetical protein
MTAAKPATTPCLDAEQESQLLDAIDRWTERELRPRVKEFDNQALPGRWVLAIKPCARATHVSSMSLQHGRGQLRGGGARTLQRVVCAPKSFFELCPQLFQDPDYLQWVNSSDPAADRYLIERVVARWSTQPAGDTTTACHQ